MSAGIRSSEIGLFTRRLSDLTAGGLPLSRSLDILARQSRNHRLNMLIRTIHADVETGESFSAALARHNGCFGPVYVGVIQAAESSGDLDRALADLSQLMETEWEVKQKVQAALIYPLLLLSVAVAVVIFLTVYVIPRFQFLFDELGQRLPLPTRLLIGGSHFLRDTWGLLFLVALVGAILSTRYKSSVRAALNRWLRRVPVISNMTESLFLERWTRLMTSLLKNGFTVPEALRLSQKTLGSSLYAQDYSSMIRGLEEGLSLSDALRPLPQIPPMVCELIAAGEESGSLEGTFERLSGFFEREVRLKSRVLLSFLEPALILGMGLVVGFVAISMLLPIFEMSASFR